MVLAGTGRPAGADPGHVDLVDAVERPRRVRGQEAREPGREGGAGDDGDAPLGGLGVEIEEVPDVADGVADRDHGAAPAEELGGGPPWRAHPASAR